ncbi:hypothetical protein J437_LFUL012764, partial [Ladona fulva]
MAEEENIPVFVLEFERGLRSGWGEDLPNVVDKDYRWIDEDDGYAEVAWPHQEYPQMYSRGMKDEEGV